MGQLLGCAQQSICGVGNGVGLRSLPCCKQAADKSHYQNLPLSQNQELCASAPQAMFWEGFQRGGGCCTASGFAGCAWEGQRQQSHIHRQNKPGTIWEWQPSKLCFTPTLQGAWKQKIKTYSAHLSSTNIVFPFWSDEHTPAVNPLTKPTGNGSWALMELNQALYQYQKNSSESDMSWQSWSSLGTE